MRHFTALAAVVLLLATSAPAGTIVIPSIERGWVKDNGDHQATLDNYGLGFWHSTEWRDFFIFDLSSVPQEATSAVFRVYNPMVGYESPDAFETLELNPIEKTPLTLFFSDLSGSQGASAFADLGSHTVAPFASYASKDIRSTDVGVFIDIPLNAEALWDINQTINFSPSGYFGFGGKLTTASIPTEVEQQVFQSTGSHNPADGNSVLILSGPKIPEPASLSLLAMGGLAVLRRRRR